MSLASKLAEHRLSKEILTDARAVEEDLYPKGSLLKAHSEPSRSPTELEYHAIGSGYSLAHFLSHLTQLHQMPAYLESYSRSKSMEARGVNRVAHLIYHWENYILRARGLEERALQFTNAVLHLGIDPRDVRANSLLRNVHVKSTATRDILKRVSRLVQPVAGERNRIVHERGLLDEDLRRLEFWSLIRTEMPERRDLAVGRYLTEVREVVPKRVEVVERFNGECGEIMKDLFDNLAPRYRDIRNRLRV